MHIELHLSISQPVRTAYLVRDKGGCLNRLPMSQQPNRRNQTPILCPVAKLIRIKDFKINFLTANLLRMSGNLCFRLSQADVLVLYVFSYMLTS